MSIPHIYAKVLDTQVEYAFRSLKVYKVTLDSDNRSILYTPPRAYITASVPKKSDRVLIDFSTETVLVFDTSGGYQGSFKYYPTINLALELVDEVREHVGT